MIVCFACLHTLEEYTKIESTAQPFNNPYVERDDYIVTEVKTELVCPDGQKAPIFLVHPSSKTSSNEDTAVSDSPKELVLIFHSGAMSYQTPFLVGQNRLPERLTRSWAENRVWERRALDEHQ